MLLNRELPKRGPYTTWCCSSVWDKWTVGCGTVRTMVNTNGTLSFPLSRVSLHVSHCMLLPLQQNEWRFSNQGWKISCNYYNYCQYVNKRRPHWPSRKRGRLGEGDLGYLTITAQAGARSEMGIVLEKPVAAPKGAAAQPLPSPSGPHVAGYKYKTQNKKKPSRKPSKPLSFVTAEPLFTSSSKE